MTARSRNATLSAPAVAVRELTKRYGARTVVDGLSFDLPRGVVAGFIGPNGAGKTTTMAMLLGLVAPGGGTATVLGHPLETPAAYLGQVGALIEAPALWPALSAVENLRLLATLAGHDGADIASVLDVVGLTDRAGDRFGEYSLGMKQRLGIAAALLGDPALLILDEPTNGLDPAGISDMRRLIGSLAGGDRTVLVSSHLLSELEHVCDWLVVIDEGALVYQGPAEAFLDTAPVHVTLGPQHPADHERLAALVRAEGHEAVAEAREVVVTVEVGDARALAARLNRIAFDDGIVLAEVHVRRPTLESHYLTLVEGGPR